MIFDVRDQNNEGFEAAQVPEADVCGIERVDIG